MISELANRAEISKLCQELQDYADLEGTELGEVCSLLISIYNNSEYVSNPFKNEVIKEIKRQLKNFKENTEIEDREVPVMTIKELVWK